MGKLDGKVALITGGTSGIGLATAKLFRDEGAHLVLTGRDAQRLRLAQQALGGEEEVLVLASAADDLAAIDDLINRVKDRFGRLDVLFVNAAAAQAVPMVETSEAQFDEIVNVNFKGAFFLIQKSIPLLQGRASSIIVTTSIANRLGSPSFSLYAASKAALRSLVRTLALELVGHGIRVNAISPGPIATPIFDNLGMSVAAVTAKKAAIESKSPMHRFGRPDEIAKAVLFLASDDASYMVGEEIIVDGGMSQL